MWAAEHHGVENEAALFFALGDETRLRLVDRLSTGGPVSISRLCEHEVVSRQAITKHLVVLENVGLVRTRREGRERLCELQTERLDLAHGYLDRISRQWDDALGRLRRFVEE